MADDRLFALADAAGIDARYWDIEGRPHETSPATARLLLQALSLPADSEAAITESFARLAAERWREILPPAVVGAEGEQIRVPVRLAAPLWERPLRWSVELEAGGALAGECRAERSRVEESARVGGDVIELRQLTLPGLSSGYHRLHIEVESQADARLIVAPQRCHLPPGFPQQRRWGVSAQLYSLRSSSNWGIGDFTDLGATIDWLAGAGCDVVGLDPLHAIFLDKPELASPYSPNSRLYLNPLYLDVTAIPDFAACGAARAYVAGSAEIAAAKSSALVDYPAIAAAKLAVLEMLHADFTSRHRRTGSERGRAFEKYLAEAGHQLERLTLFQALSERFGTHQWQEWPAGFRDPGSDVVRSFGQEQADRLWFFAYLQWQCEEQLAEAAQRAGAAGMGIGLCRDLAVGVAADGADHWANQELFVADAHIGAPPDPFNESGQEWGVLPFNPRQLRATGYAHFAAMMRANMRCAGALRIDHVMGLRRLFIIPAGSAPSEGAYLRFPMDELLAIATLESRRNRCAIVGEDLGTVPPGLRERLAAAEVLSCRVLYFERRGQRFARPDELPPLASLSASTHDLATLRGYFTGEDLDAKARLGIFRSAGEEQEARRQRQEDIAALRRSLAEAGLLPSAEDGRPAWTPALTEAVHTYLARARSGLLMVQLGDLDGELRQTNLPGTTTAYPNWRGRLQRSLEQLAHDPELARALETIARERATAS